MLRGGLLKGRVAKNIRITMMMMMMTRTWQQGKGLHLISLIGVSCGRGGGVQLKMRVTEAMSTQGEEGQAGTAYSRLEHCQARIFEL